MRKAQRIFCADLAELHNKTRTLHVWRSYNNTGHIVGYSAICREIKHVTKMICFITATYPNASAERRRDMLEYMDALLVTKQERKTQWRLLSPKWVVFPFVFHTWLELFSGNLIAAGVSAFLGLMCLMFL